MTEKLPEILAETTVLTPQIKAHVDYFSQEKDSDREAQYKNDFSVEENQILHAWYILDAIERLERIKNINKIKIEEIKQTFYWAYTWRTKINKTDMDKIENHLREVCKYHMDTYKQPYHQAWLLDFNDTFYDRILKKHFPRLSKKEDAAATATGIGEL